MLLLTQQVLPGSEVDGPIYIQESLDEYDTNQDNMFRTTWTLLMTPVATFFTNIVDSSLDIVDSSLFAPSMVPG